MTSLFLTLAAFVIGLLVIAFGRVGYEALVTGWRLVRSLGPSHRPEGVSGLLAPSCGHADDPVPVEVHDTLTGEPETARWLCPLCFEPVPAPFVPPVMHLDAPPADSTIPDGFVYVHFDRDTGAPELRPLREMPPIVLPAGVEYHRLGCREGTHEWEEVRTHQRTAPVRTVCTTCGEIAPDGLHDVAKPVYTGVTSSGERPGHDEQEHRP